DSEQNLAWLRSSPCLPPSLDLALPQPYYQPPLAAGPRLYVAQAGVPGIECVDAETGQLRWRRGLAGLRRIMDLAGEVLLVETVEGVVALNAETGALAWQRGIPEMLDGFVRPGPGFILCSRSRPPASGPLSVGLVWLDLQTGQSKGESVLRGLPGRQSRVGPMIVFQNRLWSFTGASDAQPAEQARRELLELVPGR
ncbi:MAG: PQQ-binding-like beta-propeller repeat protein, partial [Thermoguttaceae bacterium]